jgi:hypothetical protein
VGSKPDLAGVALAGRLSEAPEGYRPREGLPDTVSVVFAGMHVPEPTLDVVESGVNTLAYRIWVGLGAMSTVDLQLIR